MKIRSYSGFIPHQDPGAGFTLPEMMIASALLIISLGVILNTYLYSERYFKAGTAQIVAVGNARKAYRRITNDIRRASSATVYISYGPGPIIDNPGNYIEIDMPTGPDVGYYLNSNNEIRYIPDISSDDKGSQSDDILIATNIYGTNIFKSIFDYVSIAFIGFSKSPGPGLGYHSTIIETYVRARNSSL